MSKESIVISVIKKLADSIGYRAHLIKKETEKERVKKWQIENKEKFRNACRKWEAKHKEERAAYRKEWYRKRKESKSSTNP